MDTGDTGNFIKRGSADVYKKIKLYSYLGTTLGGLTVVFCSLYNSIFMKYLDAKLMVGILAIIAAIQALFSNLIYKNIKKYYPED